MPLTSYLPDSPEKLSTIEGWLYFAIFVFGLLAVVSGYVVVKVRGYRAGIEKQVVEKELAETRKELEDTRRKGVEAELTTKAELEKARKRADHLEARQAPRRLTSVQRSQLIALLSGKSGAPVTIDATANNAEAMQYAMDIGHTLQEAGWKVDGVHSVTVLGANPIGLSIAIKDQKSPPAGVEILLGSFRKVGLEVTSSEKSGTPSGTINVMVGSKPF